MNKTIIAILMFFECAFSALNEWGAGGWDHPIVSTDSLVVNSTSTLCSLTTAITVRALIVGTGYTGAFKDGGHSVNITGTLSLDKLYGTGAISCSGTWYVAGVGDISFTVQNWNGIFYTSGMTFNITGTHHMNLNTNKLPLKQISFSSDSIYIHGDGGLDIREGHPCIKFNGGKINNNIVIQAAPYGNEALWTGDAGSITGTGGIWASDYASNYRISIPKIKTENNLVAWLPSSAGADISLVDTVGSNGLYLNIPAGSTFHFSNSPCSTGTLYTFAGAGIIYGGTGTLKIGTATLQQAGGSFYLNGMDILCHGDWINTGAAGTVVPGSGSVTFDVGCTVTSGGSKFNKIHLTNTSGTVAATDTIRSHFLYGAGNRSGTWVTCGISGLTPHWGAYGDTISVDGSYSSAPSIRIDGEACTVVSSTGTSARVIVPSGLSGESMSVTASVVGMSDTLWYGFCCDNEPINPNHHRSKWFGFIGSFRNYFTGRR